jgi:hypothetical protein
VIGTQAAGKMIGEWPGLAKGLNAEGNVKATSDCRGLYCSLLEQWLGQEAGPVIPGAAWMCLLPCGGSVFAPEAVAEVRAQPLGEDGAFRHARHFDRFEVVNVRLASGIYDGRGRGASCPAPERRVETGGPVAGAAWRTAATPRGLARTGR